MFSQYELSGLKCSARLINISKPTCLVISLENVVKYEAKMKPVGQRLPSIWQYITNA